MGMEVKAGAWLKWVGEQRLEGLGVLCWSVWVRGLLMLLQEVCTRRTNALLTNHIREEIWVFLT
jgi:hypothetical protein